MSDEELKEMIGKAISIVSEVEERYRIPAFQMVLEKMMEGNAPRAHITSIPAISPTQLAGKSIEPDHGEEELAKSCRITIDQLHNVFDFVGDGVSFIVPLSGSENEKQETGCMCILAAHEVVYGREWIESTTLKETLRQAGVGSLTNLSTMLKSRTQTFRMKAVAEKKKTPYKLTDIGKRDAFERIRRLAIGGNESQTPGEEKPA